MRVIHVVITGRSEFLGGDRHVLSLSAAQKARGSSPMLMTDTPSVLAQSLRREGIPVVILEEVDRDAPFPRPEITRDLIAQFEGFGAQVIHCHDLSGAKLTISAANQAAIPCLLTVHVTAGRVLLTSYQTARRLGLKLSLIAVSKRQFEFLRENGIPDTELHYVPNGTKGLSPGVAREPHRPELMLVGSLAIDKGVDVAILAMAELRRRLGPDCPILNAYGAGSADGYFQDMARALSLTGLVRFHGFQLDVIDRCDRASMLVMPSRGETGPLVVQEAMSRGMPIVATDVGEVSEMLPDQRFGEVVRPGSIGALADGIESLLRRVADGHFDPAPVIERYQSRYTIEKMAENIEAAYERALAC